MQTRFCHASWRGKSVLTLWGKKLQGSFLLDYVATDSWEDEVSLFTPFLPVSPSLWATVSAVASQTSGMPPWAMSAKLLQEHCLQCF